MTRPPWAYGAFKELSARQPAVRFVFVSLGFLCIDIRNLGQTR